MTSMTGSCLCGSVRYEVSGEPLFARFCCCRDCQRQSGSGHAAGWGFPATGFRLIRGSRNATLRQGIAVTQSRGASAPTAARQCSCSCRPARTY